MFRPGHTDTHLMQPRQGSSPYLKLGMFMTRDMAGFGSA